MSCPPNYPGHRYDPPPGHNPGAKFAGYTGGALAVVLSVVALIFLGCCFGGIAMVLVEIGQAQTQPVPTSTRTR